MKKHALLSFIILILFGCHQQRERQIRFSEEQINSLQMDSTLVLPTETNSAITLDFHPFLKDVQYDLGRMIKDVVLVPLETTNKSLISTPLKVIASDSNIYIMDEYKGQGLIIFDRDGKFVKRLPSGQGPGELYRLYDFAFDKENNELVAYQHPFMMFFTPSGQYLRQTRLSFGFYNFMVIPEGYVFKTLDSQGNEHLGDLKDNTLLITDKNFRLISAGLPFPSDYNGLGNRNQLYNNNSIEVTLKGRDTVFQYVNESNLLRAEYVIDYSKKKMPEQYLFGGSYQDFDRAARQNDYFFYVGEFFDTHNHSYFNLKSFNGDRQVYRDKCSGNMIGGYITNTDTNILPFYPYLIYGTYGKYFISMLYLQDFKKYCDKPSQLSDKNKQIVKNLKEDDNETLIFFELKDF
ncbi:MAG: hypothetical protein BGO29_01275 [Bacteroidales bacterium 36-12]|nr:MAG: hypothetical protein BGO29_01275 [Bacteroidales bacterium 36-12]